MMRKKITSVLMAAAMVLSTQGLPVQAAPAEKDDPSAGQEGVSEELIAQVSDYTGTATKVYADTYAEPGRNRNWREGMVSGNGENGVVTSGAPYSDTLIYQNINLIMPSDHPRKPLEVIPGELEPTREAVFNNDDSWNFNGRGRYFNYCYHPAHQLRLTMDAKDYSDYQRWTDYETAEVGVEYTDEDGQWERKTFTSREDNVTITEIKESSEGEKINMTISIDNPSSMYKFGNGDETRMQYKKMVDESADYIAIVGHYPAYTGSELIEGGYAGVTQVIVEGGSKEKVSLDGSKDSQNVGGEANPGIEIKDADAVYLITQADRTNEMGALGDFAGMNQYDIVDELYSVTSSVAEKYSQDGAFDYEAALAPHAALHGEQFDNVKFSLNASESDRALTNNALLEKQKNSDELNDAIVERAYNAGRYAELCCSGYSTPMLCGMWTGEWNPGWRGIWTMDANVNLQVAPMNTGNMADTPVGYIYFVLRQIDDWMLNAEASYGMHDALQVPVNTDGSRAVMIESDAWYPFQYWNAGASWMLLPIYEYWQCYGNQQIPLTDSVDLYEVRQALGVEDGGLSEEEVDAIMEKGYLDLEEDILLPLLTKQANFWEQFCTPEYYTDADGVRHHDEGKTDLNLEAGERYLMLPCYSPENHPLGYTSTMTVNATMDIAAAKDGLQMTIAMENAVNREGKEENIARWEKVLAGLPDYEYDGEPGVETSTGGNGALREWATQDYTENNNHRHISHLYVAWPAYETQYDEELEEAAKAALANRDRLNTGDNTTGHGWMHHSLISARLKDGSDIYESLDHVLSSDIYYTSMMTDHNTNRGSDTYCTDTSIGLVGVINEALVFSNTGEIEILPALPEQWESGSIDGLMARTQAEIESLSWDTEKGVAEVTIRSDKDQTIELKSGQLWVKAELSTGEDVRYEDGEAIELSMTEGETVTVRFIKEEVDKEQLKADIDAAQAELDARQPENFPVSNETVNQQMADAIEAAQAVYDNDAATEREVREASWSLVDVLRIFREAYNFTFDVSLSSGVYEGKQNITITHNPEPRLQIRYTLDGSEPTMESELYEGTFTLPAGVTHLKAAQFAESTGEQIGDTLSREYFCGTGPDYTKFNSGITSTNANWSGEVPSRAIDGDSGTRWAVQGDYDTYVLEISLDNPIEIDSLAIDEYVEVVDSEDHRLTGYELQYYSDGEWKTAYTFSQDDVKDNDLMLRPDPDAGQSHAYYAAEFEPVTAESLRLVMTATKEISIWEFSVYNSQSYSQYDNIAQGRPVTASSEDGPTPKANAVDGDWNTRWAASSYNFPESVTVDLQGEYYIEDIYTLFELASGFQFKLEYSRDGENWITYADCTDNTEEIFENLSEGAAVADYVRLTITGSTDRHWASIWELQVYGSRITSMSPAEISGTVNEEIALPETLSLTLESGEVKEYGIQWEDASVIYDTEGSYEVTGTVPELDDMAYTVSVLVSSESEPPAEPDRTALNVAIAQAESIVETDYTPSSYAVMEEKLTAAKAVADNPDATQEEINTAADELNQAITGLVEAADKADLNTILIQVRSILADQDSYLASSIEGLADKAAEAETLLNDPEASQADVDAMVTALQGMIDAAVKGADKSALQAAVDEAGKYDLTLYTEDSVKALEEALASAQALLENSELSAEEQEAVDAAADALNKAMDALELKEDPGDVEQPGGDDGGDVQPGDDSGDDVQQPGGSDDGKDDGQPGGSGNDKPAGNTGDGGNQAADGSADSGSVQTPQTGDTTNLMIPFAAAGIALAGMMATAVLRRKKNK